MASFARRVRVIGPTLGVMTLWVAWFNGDLALLPCVTTSESAVLLLGPYAGPFVGLWGYVLGFENDSLSSACATGPPLLAAIASHPACPRVWTGILTILGVLVWFLLSMSYIHQASA